VIDPRSNAAGQLSLDDRCQLRVAGLKKRKEERGGKKEKKNDRAGEREGGHEKRGVRRARACQGSQN